MAGSFSFHGHGRPSGQTGRINAGISAAGAQGGPIRLFVAAAHQATVAARNEGVSRFLYARDDEDEIWHIAV